MKYNVLLFCPDHHIVYNLRTLDETGVGGGITARIRLAHALADLGHSVTACVNCPREETIQDVRYRHYSHVSEIHADIAIFSSSGGSLDLEQMRGMKVDARLKLLLVHGVTLPANVAARDIDYVYALSNYVRKIALDQWQIPPRKLFVTYRGVIKDGTFRVGSRRRDPFNLVYFGHPSKGLEAAVQVLKILRGRDERFTLHVFGGDRLWGMPEGPAPVEEGVVYHGLIGQKELAVRLRDMNFSLNLQTREEPFGMVVTESMNAGCIVLASPVGAFPEIVQDGGNGFLIPGDPSDPHTQAAAADRILTLLDRPGEMEEIRENAFYSPHSWATIARSWTGHWDWVLAHGNPEDQGCGLSASAERCPSCGGACLSLADGAHCLDCGYYRRFTLETIDFDNLLQQRGILI